MKIKHNSVSEAWEAGLDAEDYYNQWSAVTLEVGKTYKQAKGTWQEFSIEIIAIVDDVAIGKVVDSKDMGSCTPKGKKIMFHCGGYRTGWVYRDDRSIYRLQDC